MVGLVLDNSGTSINKVESSNLSGPMKSAVYQCKCSAVFQAKEQLVTHLLIEHEGPEVNLSSEAVAKSLNTVKKRVKYLLLHNPDCRDSDVQLILEYMKRWAIKQDGKPLFATDPQTNVTTASGSKEEWDSLFSVYESIRRMREDIQNPEIGKMFAGLQYNRNVVPCLEVAQRRYKRMRTMRKVMSQQKLGEGKI